MDQYIGYIRSNKYHHKPRGVVISDDGRIHWQEDYESSFRVKDIIIGIWKEDFVWDKKWL